MTNWPRGWLFVSSLQVGDAQSVLVQLPDIIADYLASGRTVNIKGLGNFYPAITSEPVERIEECTADKVRISRICFKAAGSFMQRIYRHLDLFSFQVQELKKELKKEGVIACNLFPGNNACPLNAFLLQGARC